MLKEFNRKIFYTVEVASGASQETIRKFFNQGQRVQKLLTKDECFNVYIANNDWAIIPDFNPPA